MNLTFANPHFFWLVAVIPVLIGLKLLIDARSRKMLERAVAARLIPRLVAGRNKWRGWLALAFESLALIFLTAALARPQLGFVEEEILTSGRSILLAVDTSRSMLATDLEPDRLTRTKLVITDLIAKLATDRIGLIAFAGKPFLQAPITQDHDALLETLDQTDTEIIPRGGSNLAEAIDLAVESFKGKNLPPGKTVESLSPEEKLLIEKSQATSQALIIFSDGEELEGEALSAAKRAADANVTIITIGVGTKDGGIIPNPDNGGRDYIRDQNGKIVKTVLQQQILEEVARTTKGLYLPLAEVLQNNRLDLILSKLDASTNKNKTLKKAVDRYYWPLAASLFFFLVAIGVRVIRRHVVAAPPLPVAPLKIALVVCMFLIVGTGSSFAEKQPEKLVTPEHDPAPYQKALDSLVIQRAGGNDHFAWKRLGEGSIAYAKGDFDAAVENFGKAVLGENPELQTQARFNLANSLFQRAKVSATQAKKMDPEALGNLITTLTDSVESYAEALKLKNDHAEAAKNKKTVEDFIKQLKQEKEKQEQKQEGKDKKKGDKSDKGKDKGEGQEGEEGQESEGEGEGEGKQGKAKKEGEKKEGEQSEGKKDENGSGEGDKPKDTDKGKGKDGEPKEDGRTEEQKQKEKEAQQASNQERKGKVEPLSPGNDPGKSQAQAKQIAEAIAKEMAKDAKTGFSRSEARKNLNRFSDDVQVRPQIENAQPDRVSKNW